MPQLFASSFFLLALFFFFFFRSFLPLLLFNIGCVLLGCYAMLFNHLSTAAAPNRRVYDVRSTAKSNIKRSKNMFMKHTHQRVAEIKVSHDRTRLYHSPLVFALRSDVCDTTSNTNKRRPSTESTTGAQHRKRLTGSAYVSFHFHVVYLSVDVGIFFSSLLSFFVRFVFAAYFFFWSNS